MPPPVELRFTINMNTGALTITAHASALHPPIDLVLVEVKLEPHDAEDPERPSLGHPFRRLPEQPGRPPEKLLSPLLSPPSRYNPFVAAPRRRAENTPQAVPTPSSSTPPQRGPTPRPRATPDPTSWVSQSRRRPSPPRSPHPKGSTSRATPRRTRPPCRTAARISPRAVGAFRASARGAALRARRRAAPRRDRPRRRKRRDPGRSQIVGKHRPVHDVPSAAPEGRHAGGDGDLEGEGPTDGYRRRNPPRRRAMTRSKPPTRTKTLEMTTTARPLGFHPSPHRASAPPIRERGTSSSTPPREGER